ncbi:AGAP008757-PA, related [Neospora caninum Liverpool]|uniref:BOS complex subunit TMEM147 n=1 Tax=Neospora caninum (strain Liverpool) TaxID=572307 RepID=F0VLV7_NEOCL|nr:AGAP008757-PA, related [Neospora caninum Liverpool]CBZ54235.1 AGAP008757-PA, related [Neospora caninum Liverpool]|eukprot:XP_003884266.1 AGAP008757-PA, related [Neospora caninum Liverpool]
MTLLHFFASSVCCFGPIYAVYKATEVSDQAGTLWLIALSATSYLFTQLLRSLVVASLVPATCHLYFVCEAFTQILWGVMEVIGLYFVVHHRTAMTFDADSRLLSIGLGWSFAHSLFTNLLPIISSARTVAFHWKFLYGALSANVSSVGLFVLNTGVARLRERLSVAGFGSHPSVHSVAAFHSRLLLGSTPSTAPAETPAWWVQLVLQAIVAASVGFFTLQLYRSRAAKGTGSQSASTSQQGHGSTQPKRE